MRTTIAIPFLSVIALGLLVSSCGGGGGEGTTVGADGSTTDLTTGSGGESSSIDEAEFVQRGNAICERVSGKIRAEAVALAKEVPDSNQPAVIARLVTDSLVPGFEAELDEIAALGVPDGGESEVEAILAALREAIAAAKKSPATFMSQPRSLSRIEVAGTRYGLTECPLSSSSSN